MLDGGRFDVISLGFVLALWSGSRALNVFVDTITIMHGLGGHRGIVKTRALSFVLYILAMVTGVISIPLVVAGPTLVGELAARAGRLPDDVLLAGGDRDLHLLPGHALPRVGAGADQLELQPPGRDVLAGRLDRSGSYLLRWVLTVTAADSRSIYGPLAAPIAVLLWLYLVALAVLIGAAVNAAFDTVFPQKDTTRARLELVQRLRHRISRTAPDGTSYGRLDSARADLRRPARAGARRAGSRCPSGTGRRGGSWAAGCWPRSAILVGTVLLVYFDRDGYIDNNDPTGRRSASSTRSTTRPSR